MGMGLCGKHKTIINLELALGIILSLEKMKEEMDRNKEEMAEELDRRCKEEMGSYKEEMERYKEEQIETKGALDRLLQQLKPVLSSSSKSSQPVPKVTRHFDMCTSFTDFAKHSVIQKTPKPSSSSKTSPSNRSKTPPPPPEN